MTCKICNFDTIPWEDSQTKKTYHYCQNCECVSLDSVYYLSLIDEKKAYGNHHNSLENEGYVQMFENFLDFFWEEITCNKKCLDFGSGPTPVLSELLMRRGAQVTCYDKFYHPDTSFEQHRYDFITSTEVFEHLSDPLSILSLFHRILTPNGIVALMTLFHQNSASHFEGWWYKRDHTHITFYTPKTIAMMAEKCGFDIIKCDDKRIVVLRKR